jgi:hypothetical protein
MQSLRTQLLELAKEDRKGLIEMLNENYIGESLVLFYSLGEVNNRDAEFYCYDCGAIGKSEEFCKICRSVNLSQGEIIESIDVIALDNGTYADIRDAAVMEDHDD